MSDTSQPPPPGDGAGSPPGWTTPGGATPGGATPGGATPGWTQPGAAPPGWGAAPTAPGGPGWGAPPPPPPGAGFGPQYGGWGPPPQAPKPGIVALRPLGVADILDGAIAYVRRDPRTVLGISAVLSLVLVVLSFAANFAAFRSLSDATSADYYDGGATDQLVTGGSLGGDLTAVVAALLTLPISVIATGLLTVVVGQAVLGRRVSAGEAWRGAKPQLWRLLGLTVLVGLIVGGIAAVGIAAAVLLGILIAQVSAPLGVLVGLALGAGAAVVTVWVAVRLLLSPAALVLERSGVVTALRRSSALVRGSWWRVFGIALLAQVIAALIAQVLTIPFAIVGVVLAVAFPSNGALWWLTLAAVSVGTFVGTLVTMPFTAGVTALQYVDQRIRREALDLELARAAGVR